MHGCNKTALSIVCLLLSCMLASCNTGSSPASPIRLVIPIPKSRTLQDSVVTVTVTDATQARQVIVTDEDGYDDLSYTVTNPGPHRVQVSFVSSDGITYVQADQTHVLLASTGELTIACTSTGKGILSWTTAPGCPDADYMLYPANGNPVAVPSQRSSHVPGGAYVLQGTVTNANGAAIGIWSQSFTVQDNGTVALVASPSDNAVPQDQVIYLPPSRPFGGTGADGGVQHGMLLYIQDPGSYVFSIWPDDLSRQVRRPCTIEWFVSGEQVASQEDGTRITLDVQMSNWYRIDALMYAQETGGNKSCLTGGGNS